MKKKFLLVLSFAMMFFVATNVSADNTYPPQPCVGVECGSGIGTGGSTSGTASGYGWSTQNQGLRIYVADADGNVQGTVRDYSRIGWSGSAYHGTGTRIANGGGGVSKGSYTSIAKQDMPMPVGAGGQNQMIKDWVLNEKGFDQFLSEFGLTREQVDKAALEGNPWYIAIEPIAYFQFKHEWYALTSIEAATFFARPGSGIDGSSSMGYRDAMSNLTHKLLPFSVMIEEDGHFNGKLDRPSKAGQSVGSLLTSSEMSGKAGYGIALFWIDELECNKDHPNYQGDDPVTGKPICEKKCDENSPDYRGKDPVTGEPICGECDPERELCNWKTTCEGKNTFTGECVIGSTGIMRDDYLADKEQDFDCIYNDADKLELDPTGDGFCKVYCTERVDTYFPGPKEPAITAGLTFTWETHTIEGTRTCRTKQINLDMDKCKTIDGTTDYCQETDDGKKPAENVGQSWLSKLEIINYDMKYYYDRWQQGVKHYSNCNASANTCRITVDCQDEKCRTDEDGDETCIPPSGPSAASTAYSITLNGWAVAGSVQGSSSTSYCDTSGAISNCKTQVLNQCKPYEPIQWKTKYDQTVKEREELLKKLGTCLGGDIPGSTPWEMTYNFEPELAVGFYYNYEGTLYHLEKLARTPENKQTVTPTTVYYDNFKDIANGNKKSNSIITKNINGGYTYNRSGAAGAKTGIPPWYECQGTVCVNAPAKNIPWAEIRQQEINMRYDYELPKDYFRFVKKEDGEIVKWKLDGGGKDMIDIGFSGIPTAINQKNGRYFLYLEMTKIGHLKNGSTGTFDKFLDELYRTKDTINGLRSDYDCYYELTCDELTCPKPPPVLSECVEGSDGFVGYDEEGKGICECRPGHPDYIGLDVNGNPLCGCTPLHPHWNEKTLDCCYYGDPNWNPETGTCDLPCPGGICVPLEDPCTTKGCEPWYGYSALVVRTVDINIKPGQTVTDSLSQTFPSSGGEPREPGVNWGNGLNKGEVPADPPSNGLGYDSSIVEYYLLNNRGVSGKKIYKEKEPMYVYELDSSRIKQIREHNKRNNFDNFDLTCASGSTNAYGASWQAINCRSNFLSGSLMMNMANNPLSRNINVSDSKVNCGLDRNFTLCDDLDGYPRNISKYKNVGSGF